MGIIIVCVCVFVSGSVCFMLCACGGAAFMCHPAAEKSNLPLSMVSLVCVCVRIFSIFSGSLEV